MGNANTHERRKSGVPETGLTIENIREKPRVEEAEAALSADQVRTGPAKQEKTPPPSFETAAGATGDTQEAKEAAGDEFRPRAGTVESGAVSGIGPYSALHEYSPTILIFLPYLRLHLHNLVF